MKKLNAKGFSQVEIVIVAIIISLVGAVGWLVYDRQNNTSKFSENTSAQTENNSTPKTEKSQTPNQLTLNSCDGSYQNGPISESKAELWKTKLSAAYKIYSIDQVCKLSDGYSVVTFKSEEAKLPVGISVFDAKSNLLVHNKLACKSLGGEGARLYVENLKDNKIEANCTSGHMGENVTQVYSFDYESLTPTLLREQ